MYMRMLDDIILRTFKQQMIKYGGKCRCVEFGMQILRFQSTKMSTYVTLGIHKFRTFCLFSVVTKLPPLPFNLRQRGSKYVQNTKCGWICPDKSGQVVTIGIATYLTYLSSSEGSEKNDILGLLTFVLLQPNTEQTFFAIVLQAAIK